MWPLLMWVYWNKGNGMTIAVGNFAVSKAATALVTAQHAHPHCQKHNMRKRPSRVVTIPEQWLDNVDNKLNINSAIRNWNLLVYGGNHHHHYIGSKQRWLEAHTLLCHGTNWSHRHWLVAMASKSCHGIKQLPMVPACCNGISWLPWQCKYPPKQHASCDNTPL